MSQAVNIIKDIKNKQLKPIYFLMGEEPYFIDKISKAIEENVLTEEERGFNQSIIYGNETDMSNLIGLAKQFPMGAERSVIIVKEAQHLSRNIDELEHYANQPQPSTVLVFNYKGKTLDKRKKVYKELLKTGLVFESKKLYDNQIPDWIEDRVRAQNNTIEPKAKFLLAEFVGSDLSRLENELQKLQLVLGEAQLITPEHIEKNIGISKDYNNFELRKAIEVKDLGKAFQIIKYFESNPKDNPFVVTLALLYGLFSSLIVYHSLADKSKGNVAKELKINPFFVNDYANAAKNYPLKKLTRIISLLREYDMKSKGVGSSGNVSAGELSIELIYKIVNI